MGRPRLERPRRALNTTIDEEILKDFKEYCEYLNIPMNVVMEMFMKQFANRQIECQLVKGEKYLVFTEDEN